MIGQNLCNHTHWQLAQIQPTNQNLPKSMVAPIHRGRNNGQHTTGGIKHCADSAIFE